MNRRKLLQRACVLPLLPVIGAPVAVSARAASATSGRYRRTLPGDPAWPSTENWESLNQKVGGRLGKVVSPLAQCASASDGAACNDVFKELKNPYYIGDNDALTQTCGWVDGWTSRPSAYAVAARTARDVVHAVNFARENKLRLVVKGGGHSYQGTSNAAGSLLVWTREMNAITLHDAFVGEGCAGPQAPQPPVTLEAGNIWVRTHPPVVPPAGPHVPGRGLAAGAGVGPV